MMRFTLVNAKERTFSAERYCFRGSVDDWIDLNYSADPPPKLIRTYLRHLGQESFYELPHL